MSTALDDRASVKPDLTAAPPPGAGRRASVAFWARVGLACLLLATSGVVRWRQASRVATVLRDARKSPFPLNDLPLDLGSWHGEPAALDPKIVRATGATDILTRRYVDRATGASLEVIVLYGPSAEVYLHRPEICYPRAGFEQVGATETRTVEAGDLKVPFHSQVYTKGEGGQADLLEVYCSWRYNGGWSPKLGTQKQFERIPGMYKIHLSRRVTGRERRDIDNPCESFLRALMPELERRLGAAVARTASSPGRSPEGRIR